MRAKGEEACTLVYLAASEVLISVPNRVKYCSFIYDIQFWY